MRIAAGVLLAVMLGAAAGPMGAQRSGGDTAVIDRFLASKGDEGNGVLAEGIRTVVKGDLNHDGVPDAAVLYTLEGAGGGNNYTQYLAVLLRVDGRLVPVANNAVGGKLYRSIAIKAIKDNVILCDTLDYAKNDAACCPTIKGKTQYVLKDKKLKEVKATPAKP
ncbi:MAG TPA: hypothetical protein VG033_09760 [Candidatus Acidoferrales bacterium]|jgi:hypothetical protein|nr:hypothetical protein [Candidatus Acidoferrales bacterium]